jgi:hypothetical protein
MPNAKKVSASVSDELAKYREYKHDGDVLIIARVNLKYGNVRCHKIEVAQLIK